MDVRCEKCQTEYELDESRLKPGGVTVKCTNCGHMFKIRKRTITNVGTPTVSPNVIDRGRADSGRQPVVTGRRADSIFDEVTRQVSADEVPTSVERQWLIRLENGEQKRCSELATLQQWIVAGVVTRESLISRTGKTWKRLGDIVELGQYFVIADEARAKRGERQTAPTPKPGTGTMLGIAGGPATQAQAAGGTIVPDEEEARTTGNYPQRRPLTTPPPAPGRVVRTPPMGSNAATPPAGAAAQPESPALAATQPARVVVQPVAQPVIRPPSHSPPAPVPVAAPPAPAPAVPLPQGNRATAAWADAPVPTEGVAPSGPFVGKLSAIPDEPAFAGRVRVAPGDESSFETGKVRMVDDDDDLLPIRRGSRAGMWMLVLALLVMGAAAGLVYVFVMKKDATQQATAPKDAAPVAVVTPDAAPIVTPVIDAPPPPLSPLDAARKELDADVEPRLKTAIQSLEGKDDPPSQTLRAHLLAQLAQDELDRAGLLADKAAAEALRKDAHQLVLDAATAAQRAFKAAGDDAGANVAMAEVLRLQGKSARDIKRYLDTARAKNDKDWAADIALADALTLARDGKLDDAKAAFAAADQGDGKLETSGDVRARYHQALVLAAQNKPADAKPLVDAILAAQPEHAGAKALATKLETLVAKTDPLPPEDHGADHGAGNGSAQRPRPPGPDVSGGGSYDQLLARANALAESNCTRALELYGKALEQKPNGVEALTGMGYCHIDAKQFFAAFSNFRAALAVSPKYEPALWGVGEAYTQQGLKQQAIDAYKAYLEVYPDSAKAKKALERLGADSGTQTPPAGSGSSGPVTNPTPTPTPAPAPAAGDQPGAGSGSG